MARWLSCTRSCGASDRHAELHRRLLPQEASARAPSSTLFATVAAGASRPERTEHHSPARREQALRNGPGTAEGRAGTGRKGARFGLLLLDK